MRRLALPSYVGAHDMTPDPTPAPSERERFRWTLLRVMAVQVVTLLLLGLLQARYTG